MNQNQQALESETGICFSAKIPTQDESSLKDER